MGADIIYADRSGVEQLRISCRPPGLLVVAPAFAKIGSEERLTLGAGDELATLVVSQAAPENQPLTATGELPEGFADALAQGRPLAVSYGASQLGPLPPLPAEMRAAFAAICPTSLRDLRSPTAAPPRGW